MGNRSHEAFTFKTSRQLSRMYVENIPVPFLDVSEQKKNQRVNVTLGFLQLPEKP